MKVKVRPSVRATNPGSLKPQDLVVLLKILVLENKAKEQHGSFDAATWTLSELARGVGISTSEVHYSLKRAEFSRLWRAEDRRVIRRSLEEFVVHGVKYIFPAIRGSVVRGIPTSYAASPLKEMLVINEQNLPVWPYPEGRVRGISFSPLYPAVPEAAMQDSDLYELLALIDIIRDDPRAREQSLAIEILQKKIQGG